MHLTGNKKLTNEDLISIARLRNKLSLSPEIKNRVTSCRSILENSLENGSIIYGVNTGFGALKLANRFTLFIKKFRPDERGKPSFTGIFNIDL